LSDFRGEFPVDRRADRGLFRNCPHQVPFEKCPLCNSSEEEQVEKPSEEKADEKE
jgi:hypothetical protein